MSPDELIEDSVCRKFRQTAAYGKDYNALHYKEAEDGGLIEYSVVKESLTTASDEEDIKVLEKMAKDIESRKKGTEDERS